MEAIKNSNPRQPNANYASLVSTDWRSLEGLDVANPSGRLSPGTFAEVHWPSRRPKPTLFVPTSAVASNLQRTFVVRIRDGKAEWVDITTGRTTEKLTEVFGDLHENDQVVLRATDELQPGTQDVAQETKPN